MSNLFNIFTSKTLIIRMDGGTSKSGMDGLHLLHNALIDHAVRLPSWHVIEEKTGGSCIRVLCQDFIFLFLLRAQKRSCSLLHAQARLCVLNMDHSFHSNFSSNSREVIASPYNQSFHISMQYSLHHLWDIHNQKLAPSREEYCPLQII